MVVFLHSEGSYYIILLLSYREIIGIMTWPIMGSPVRTKQQVKRIVDEQYQRGLKLFLAEQKLSQPMDPGKEEMNRT